MVTGIGKAAGGEAGANERMGGRIAQEVRGGRQRPSNPFTELSDRELDVLRVIAEGLSNAQIAERLIIGEGTVKTHVTNILGKLHLVDRTQAAIFAWREGVVRKPPEG